jgi:hypothetical protein
MALTPPELIRAHLNVTSHMTSTLDKHKQLIVRY